MGLPVLPDGLDGVRTLGRFNPNGPIAKRAVIVLSVKHFQSRGAGQDELTISAGIPKTRVP